MGHTKWVFCMKGGAWTLFTSNEAAALHAYNFVLRQFVGEVIDIC